MTQHVIELNGQRYDVLTGQPLADAAKKSKPARNKSKAKALINKGGPKQLDGFSRRPNAPRQSPITVQATTRQPEKSKTLMRTAVKQPKVNKIHATAAAPTSVPKPTHNERPHLEADKPGRLIRANTVAKSSLVSKFGKAAPAIQTATVPVKEPPVSQTHHSAATTHNAHQPHHNQPAAAKEPFQAAIDNATSHEQPKALRAKLHHRVAKRLHVSPRAVGLTSVTLMVLGVGGVIVQQNIPTIAMQVAATRSGVNASLPEYQPAGYSMAGPIKYQTGEVSVNYASNSDNRSFNVTQKASGWNSETLLENYVSSSKQPYQTFQANGRTIYIYDGNKATWVDGGIWFDVDGKANLTSDQLLRIAESL